jgi:3-oxoacyl-[acyl-carrier protein] reductase
MPGPPPVTDARASGAPIVVITGVGRAGQMGAFLASDFADHGTVLHLVGRTIGEVEARADELRQRGADARAHACDLADAPAVAALASTILARHPDGIDALVHAAGGFALSGSVADGDADAWARMHSINLVTAHVTARAFIPLLRTRQGAIVFFASAAVLPGARVARQAAYAAAKSGVVILTRAIAVEEAAHGVRANAVAPTAIRTGDNVRDMGEDAAYVEPSAVAAAVRFLCSSGSAGVNGQVIRLG